MKALPLIVLIVFPALKGFAQSHVAVTNHREDPSIVRIKWYCPQLVSEEGFHVYRQSRTDAAWSRLTVSPVKYKEVQVTAKELASDKDLAGYLALSADKRNFKSLALIAVLVKSFSSEPLCRYLGNTFIDSTQGAPAEYRYKVTLLAKAGEKEVAQSEWISTSGFERLKSPDSFRVERRGRSVLIGWHPEPMRYYGVNVYRRHGDTGAFVKINNEPVLTTMTKQQDGHARYPRYFIEDRLLRSKTKVSYYIEGLDFFSQTTVPSGTSTINIPDEMPPPVPDSVRAHAAGRKVTVSWRRPANTSDAIAYNIYRTTNNDTDFRKVNGAPLPRHTLQYTDSAPRFGHYFYKVEAFDEALNSAGSNPVFADAYDNEPPMSPQKLQLISDTGRLILRWKKNKEADVAGYLVYRTVNADKSETFVKCTPRPVLCCEYIESLPKHTRNRFLYKVVAVDSAMNRSDYSACASARLPDVTAPSAPFLQSAETADDGERVKLRWFANPESDLLHYVLFRQEFQDSSKSPEKMIGRLSRTATETIVTMPVGNFCFRLAAVDSSGNLSAPSNTLVARRAASGDAIPEIAALRGEYSEARNEISLRWKTDNIKRIRGIVLYRAKEAGEFEAITGFIKDQSLHDRDLSANTRYTYQLRAYANDGSVFKSREIIIKTKS